MGAHSPEPDRLPSRRRSAGFRPKDVCALADRPAGAHADGWRMLHPLGLLVALVDSVRSMVSLAVSMIVVARIIVRSHAWSLPAIIAFAVMAALAQPIARWASTRYRLGPDALSFRSGVFFRRDRTISYGSIHAIDGSSPIYLRPFGVVRLTVSAAGAGDTDITLDAVPASLQLELERARAADAEPSDIVPIVGTDAAPAGPARPATAPHGTDSGPAAGSTDSPIIAADGAGTATPRPTSVTSAWPYGSPVASSIPTSRGASQAVPSPVRGDTPVFRASTRDILLFAITDLGFLAAAFVVYGFVQNVQDMLPRDWTRTAERTVGDYAASGVLAVAMLVTACVIVLMAVSIVTSLLRFHGFEVWRRGDDLVVVRGLITRRTTTIPVSRIQTIVIRRSPLRRPFRLCSVGLGLSSSAGGDGEENAAVSAERILPVIGTRRVHAVLHAMLPEWDVREPVDAPTGRAAARTATSSADAIGAGDAPGPGIRRTGRGLLRYYVTMPIAATAGATITVGAGTALMTGWKLWWLMFAPLAIGTWWTACRWLKSHAEGYAIVPDSPAGDIPPDVLPHRIVVTGAKGLTTFTMTTRRSRVQSAIRSTTLWREPRGIERLRMPLFVMNGVDELRFTFLDRTDADRLERWLEV